MIKFTYTEEDGRNIEMTYDSYSDLTDMCSMFRDFVAARGFEKAEIIYEFEDEAFETVSVDRLCEEWRDGIQLTEDMTPEQIVEATIDAIVLSDKYYLRRFL